MDGAPEPDEQTRDRLAELLPDEALDRALNGLSPEEVTGSGSGGLLAQLAGRMIDAALAGELADHLGYPPGQAPPGRVRQPSQRVDTKRRSRPIRYYFGGHERLLVYVARHEHLARLDRVRRALRKVNNSQELAAALLTLADDLDHFQVSFGLLTEARQMPELQAAEAELWEDWIAKLTEMVAELKARGAAPADQDPYALAALWSSLTAGLAAHHLANPQIDLQPALDLAQLYGTSLR